MMKKVFYILIFRIFIAILLPAFAQAGNTCSEIFVSDRDLMARDISKFIKIPGGIHHELKFSVKDPQSAAKKYVVSARDAVENWEAIKVSSPEGDFKIVNVGYNRLNATRQNVEDIFLKEWRQSGFNRDLHIEFSNKTLQANVLITNFRWGIHDKVLEKYKGMKEYISEKQLNELAFVNISNTASDVLAVMVSSPKLVSKMETQEFKDQVALTIQVNYDIDQMGFAPTSSRYGTFTPYQNLPFNVRLKPEKQIEVLAQMQKDFKKKKLVEFARYVRFEEVPASVHARLLLEAVSLAESSGADAIIASTDHITMKLFTERYGFKLYRQFPSRSTEPEFLIYIDIGSPEFGKFKGGLQQASKKLVEKEVQF